MSQRRGIRLIGIEPVLKDFTNAVSAVAALCVTMERNPVGARYVFGLAVITAFAYVVYWTAPR